MTNTQIIQETIQVATDLEAFADDEHRIRGESFRYHATMIRHHAARLRLAVGCWPVLDIHMDPHECGLRYEETA